jgi:hypothetical protein
MVLDKLTELPPDADPVVLAGEDLPVGKVEALQITVESLVVLQAVIRGPAQSSESSEQCWGSGSGTACF